MKIRVTSAVRRDGKLHGPGDLLEVDRDTGLRLVAGGSAEPVAEEADEDGELAEAIETIARVLDRPADAVRDALLTLTDPAGAAPLVPAGPEGGRDAGAPPSTPGQAADAAADLADPDATKAEGGAGAGGQGDPAPRAPRTGAKGSKAKETTR